MKKNKFTYLYVLQGDHGYGEGYEDLCAEEIIGGKSWEPRKRIRESKKEYQENSPGPSYRIIKRREKNLTEE